MYQSARSIVCQPLILSLIITTPPQCSNGCVVRSCDGFNFHVLNGEWQGRSFHEYIGCLSSLVKSLFRFVHFCADFLLVILVSHKRFLKKKILESYPLSDIYWYFLPVWGLPLHFHLLTSILWWTEALNSNVAQFKHFIFMLLCLKKFFSTWRLQNLF